VVAALVEQDGPCLGRGLVGEPVAVQGVEDLLSFLFGEGGRVRRPFGLLLFPGVRAGVFRAPQGSPGSPEQAARLAFRGGPDERREEFAFYFF